jgi:hypothetical protein
MSDVSFQITGDDSAFVAALKDAQAAAETTMAAIQTSVSKVGEAFQAVTAGVGGFAAMLGAGGIVESLTRITERATDLSTFSQVLAINTDQLQALYGAAEAAGVPTEQLAHAAEDLGAKLLEARQGSGSAISALRELGVSVQQLHDPTFGVNELLGELGQRLRDPATAAATMAQLVKELGARAAVAAEAIKQFDSSSAGVAARMAEVNGLSTEQIERLHEAGTGWKALTTWVANAGEKMAYYALMAKDAVISAQLGGKGFAADTSAADSDRVGTIQRQTQQATQVQVDAATQVTLAVLESTRAQVEATQQGTEQRIALARQLYQESLTYYGSGQVAEVVRARSEMMAAEKSYHDSVDRMVQESAAMTLEAGRRATEGHQQEAAILQRINQDHIAQVQQALQEEISINERALATELEQIRAKAQAHLITINQERDAVIAANNAELQSVVALMQQEQQLFVQGDAEFAKLQAEMTAQSQKTGAAIMTANATAAKQTDSAWKGVTDAINKDFTNALTAALTHTKTFAQAGREALTQFTSSAINGLVKMGEQAAMSAMLGTGASGSAAEKQIMNNAYTAASGAYSAMASIPYIGPMLGAIAAAATFAAVAAFGSSVVSSAGGYDVPHDTMAMLHADETVIPKPLADTYRRAADSLTGGGGARGGGGDTHHHHHYGPSADAKSFERMIAQPGHQRALEKQMSKAMRRRGLR